MREAGIADKRTGLIWNFIVQHPKSQSATLIIQPPKAGIVKDALPVFDARQVLAFLNDVDLD